MMPQLSARERRLVALMVALLVAGLGYLIVHGLIGYRADLARQLEAQRRTLALVQGLDQDLGRLQPAAAGRVKPLPATLDDMVSQSNLRDRAQLTPITQAPGSKVQSADLRMDQMTLDETMNLLYRIENEDPPLVIDQINLSPSFKAKDLLRVSLRVLAQN